MRRLLIGLALCVAALGASAQGKTLRFASAFDPQTMDPHALALLYQTRVVTQIYESLVNRDKAFRLEPSLATSWEMTSPTTWRFKLRPGVKFHDGAPFTAMSGGPSAMRISSAAVSDSSVSGSSPSSVRASSKYAFASRFVERSAALTPASRR